MEDFINIVYPATLQTIYMCTVASIFSVFFGFILAIILYVTEEDGILPNKFVNSVLGYIVNVGRSIPFAILIFALLPIARMIVGTSIGSTAAIVPLTIAATPFVARVVENSLKELDKGVIEAAISMGASNFELITQVIIPETASSIVLAITTSIISIIGYSAMAGIVGGGGLGDVAKRYGFDKFRNDILLITIVILVVMVQVVQYVGGKIAKSLDKR